MKYLLAFSSVFFLFAFISVAAELDPNLPYQAERSNPVTYEVDFSAVVTPPYKCKTLKVWLPLPQSDFGQEVTEGTFETFPMSVSPKIGTEKVFGNKFAYFEFPAPEGAQVVRHKFSVKVWELRWNIDPEKIIAVKDYPASFDCYRRGEEQAVVVDERFSKLLKEIVPNPSHPLRDMDSVMQWVIGDFKYAHATASLAASSVNGLEVRGGHCSDYHGFCSSLGRVMGYPTRMTYGINPFPKNSPSHCKMETYLPPYGWVSFDVSETQRLLEKIAKDDNLDENAKQELSGLTKKRLIGGFRDNTWFIQTRGSDYDLEPPAAKRAAVVRTIYAEADGVALPEPDPANRDQKGWAWMTVHKYTSDREVTYPFSDLESLK